MKKMFLFFSVLLTFTIALANAPPVLEIPDVTVEFLVDNLDVDYDIVTVDAIQTVDVPQVALPLAFYTYSSPVMSVITDPGTLDVRLDIDISAEAIQGTLNDRNLYGTVIERSRLSLANLNNSDDSKDKNPMNLFYGCEVISTNEYHTTYCSI